MSHEWPDFIGGVGVVGYNLADLLKDEYRIDVLSRRIPQFKYLDAVTHRFIPNGRYLWILFYPLFLFFNHHRYDYIILNEAAPTLSAGVGLHKKILNRKCFVLLHGLELEHFYDKFGLKRLFRSSHERAVKYAKKRIFVSKYYQDKYKLQLPTLRETTNLVIYPTFWDVPTSDNSKSTPKSDVLRFLTVSRLDLRKGFHHFLPIMEYLKSIQFNFTWTIIGDGNDKHKITSLFKDFDEVQFLGPLGHQAVQNYYKHADIFVLLSDYSETFGLVYTEAQRQGLYCLASQLGATNESVHSGNGLLVDTSKLTPWKVLENLQKRPPKLDIQLAAFTRFSSEKQKWKELFVD